MCQVFLVQVSHVQINASIRKYDGYHLGNGTLKLGMKYDAKYAASISYLF